ncbi:MAG: hypothetical protein QG636_131 [Patescibacteria group bacterium]|jgi:hypothetical protein|nr:hypothetical protein [Patescibacteria group bacterium]
MNPLRAKALALRLKGKSYNEINSELGIPKATLSGWLKDVVLSDRARARLNSRVHQGVLNGLVKRNKLQTKEAEERSRLIRTTAKREIEKLSLENLRLIGTSLYWAEGYKRAKFRNGKERTWHAISFVNSDPEMVTLFVSFLRKVMDIPAESIRLSMRLYPHINEAEAQRYWLKSTGLLKENFCKTTNLVSSASKGIRPYNRLPWGTLQVEVCNTPQFHRLMGWIEGVKAQF